MDVVGLTELISTAFGAGVMVAFKKVPALDKWLYSIPSDFRGLVMLAISLTVPLAIVLVSCIQLYNLVPCDPNIWRDMARAWIAFVVANQGLFLMTGDSNAKKELKAKQS